MNKDWVAILDFGSQYTHLIARRVRECGVYSEIIPYSIKAQRLLLKAPRAIILSGGPASVTTANSPLPDKNIFNIGIPILGICYGAQLMGKLLGGKVARAKAREYGKAILLIKPGSGLLKGLSRKQTVWMSHGDKIVGVPCGFKIIGSTHNARIAALADENRNFYSLQFHPEVAHTPKGKKILSNFLFNTAGCKKNWNMRSFVKDSTRDIKNQVGKDKILCALSGGVDSSVLAILLHKAIGKNLTAIFIDNGLLRKDERELVKKRFKNYYRINLKVVKAEDKFLKALIGVTDPEKKRKIIGHTFIKVFEHEAKTLSGTTKLGKFKFLAQGTLYPDVIESRSPVGGPSATIKTHHNVGGLPKKMHFKLLEPLKDLFKDEVRLLGKELGLPDDLVWRQPFPGPGLAVRIIGAITKARLDILRQADWILLEEIKKAGLYRKLWQSFCVLLPVKSVGVMGDERTYENVCAVRAVTSEDAMTANWAKLPYELLERISNRIINEVKGINRVVYDISSKPPSTIEWE
ncbi:MAG: glutamine-hydrolyzing GMP synthase [Candidatus Omnitrophica bacterium]|nr:glutamine-hydrolyzing GMP synthase [Candidatus Omnitrophota bacterium]